MSFLCFAKGQTAVPGQIILTIQIEWIKWSKKQDEKSDFVELDREGTLNHQS